MSNTLPPTDAAADPAAGTTLPASHVHEGAETQGSTTAPEDTTTAPVEMSDITADVIPPRPPSTNTQQDHEVLAPLDRPWDESEITLALPSETKLRTEELLGAMPNIQLDDTEKGREWKALVQSASYTTPFRGYFDNTVLRLDAKFRQGVPSERGVLGMAVPSFKDKDATGLTGERAVLRVRALVGLGSIIQIPLWHSGFWISLKAPGESEMLELNRRLAEEKVLLGRQTYGLAFANNSVFFAGWLTDFALNNVYDCSLKDSTEIRGKISTLDIPLLMWGLACVIWPKGFQYARAVLDQITKQNSIIKEKINVGKLVWTDTSSLTPWQVGHMGKRAGASMTNEEVTRYRSEFTRGQGREVVLSDNVSLTFKVPSLGEYLTSGQKWVNNIVAMVDQAFALTPNDQGRESYIMEQGRASNLRQFTHWIESIKAGDDVITDAETIEQTMDALSVSKDISAKYFAGVQKFMEDATISLVAIPAATEAEKTDLPRFPHLLPLDVMSTFFILLVQKVQQIQSR